MLDSKGFDLWADGYDRSVGLSEEDGTYPFAGYKEVLGEIYQRVLRESGKKILDIGFGTGTLTVKLYEKGCEIYGQDFSEKMIAHAKEKMPKAHLYHGDFSKGLAGELEKERYDAILATYSLHHLTDAKKVEFLKKLQGLLKQGGYIYIGVVAFETREELEQCKKQTGESWDEVEIYFVYGELKKSFPTMEFQQCSHCAGVLSLGKEDCAPEELAVSQVSSQYQVRRLEESDISEIIKVCSGNKIYYEYCPPFVSEEGVRQDMEALPPGKTKEDKYFLGYFSEGKLIALLDLIARYPDQNTAYVGFFMVDREQQHQGEGTQMIEELCRYLKKRGFQKVELAWVTGNRQAENFWKKNRFISLSERDSSVGVKVMAARRNL